MPSQSDSLVPQVDNTPQSRVVRTSNLAPQLSEPTFRIYEPHIARAVKEWPNETQFTNEAMTDLNGKRLSPHTFVARFRDALVSLKRFGWPTYVDTNKLWSMAGQHCCAYAPDGTVWFKWRGRRGRPMDLVGEARDRMAPVDPQLVVEWHPPITEEDLHALATLIGSGKVVGPVILHVQVPAETVAALEATNNVVFHWDEGRKVMVVT